MARLRVSTHLDAPPDVVWADLADVSSHVEWMRDAVAIRFTSESHTGVGTTFDCDTKVGPFRLTDRMEITAWKPELAMGVRHVGLVTGEGVISLRKRPRGRTKLTWSEQLTFPWWMGGPLGSWAATPVLWLVWRGSMRNLRERFGN
ncbi:MAG: SRPBCC family protein [Acidimicrobiales bacterium]